MSDAPLLHHLYTVGSLENVHGGFRFGVKNRLFDATLVAVDRLVGDGDDIDVEHVVLELGDAEIPAAGVPDGGIPFPLRCDVGVRVIGASLTDGAHHLVIGFRSDPFAALELEIRDNVAAPRPARDGIPRDRDDDYSGDIIA